MIGEYKDKIRLFFIASYIILAIGSIVGGIYYVNCTSALGDIKNSWDSYVSSIKNGLNLHSVIRNTLKDNLMLICILFISAFFRVGILLSGFIVARKGFVTGFTVASIINIYGLRGLAIALSSFLQYIIIIPLMLLVFSVNTLASLRLVRIEKKIIIFYILFFFFAISIFCIEAVCEGFFSTTFMKWLLSLVT